MARKATDLLDVFRYGGGDDDEDSGRGASSKRRRVAKNRASAKKSQEKAKAKARASAPTRNSFDGLILSKRQLIMAASACCLLLVLSFVLGLSTGRPDEDASTAIRKDVPSQAGWVMIRGELPRVDPATQREIEPAQLRGTLTREYRVPGKNLRIGVAQGRLVLEIGPFRSVKAARDWLQREGLDMARIAGCDPFLRPQFPPYRR